MADQDCVVSSVAAGGAPALPAGEIPGVLPEALVVARSHDVVISLGCIEAYSTVLAFNLRVQFESGSLASELSSQRIAEIVQGRVADDPRDFTFRVRSLADESGASALPLLVSLGGGGSSSRGLTVRYALSPFPVDGAAFYASWLAVGVEGAEKALAADALQAARARCIQLFES